MPRDARKPEATWAPLPPPQMVTWRGFQPSREALSRSISALDVATESVILLVGAHKVLRLTLLPNRQLGSTDTNSWNQSQGFGGRTGGRWLCCRGQQQARRHRFFQGASSTHGTLKGAYPCSLGPPFAGSLRFKLGPGRQDTLVRREGKDINNEGKGACRVRRRVRLRFLCEPRKENPTAFFSVQILRSLRPRECVCGGFTRQPKAHHDRGHAVPGLLQKLRGRAGLCGRGGVCSEEGEPSPERPEPGPDLAVETTGAAAAGSRQLGECFL